MKSQTDAFPQQSQVDLAK